jgi:formylmethanofuran dehydrogenase subunit E
LIDFAKLLTEFKDTEYYPEEVSIETILALNNFANFLISRELEFAYTHPDPLVSNPCPECGHYVVDNRVKVDKKHVVCGHCGSKVKLT